MRSPSRRARRARGAAGRASAPGRTSVSKATYFAREVGSKRREDGAEREADPRDHHRPGLDAAQPVDALLERVRLQECIEIEHAGLRDLAFDRDGPGPRPQRVRVARRVLLVGAEFVEVVVGRGGREGRQLLVRPEAWRRGLHVRELGERGGRLGRTGLRVLATAEPARGAERRGGAQELAAPEVKRLVRDLTARDRGRMEDAHRLRLPGRRPTDARDTREVTGGAGAEKCPTGRARQRRIGANLPLGDRRRWAFSHRTSRRSTLRSES